MSRMLASLAALTLMGAAALPISANAAEAQTGISKAQSTDLSSQGYWRHRGYYGHRYYRPHRYGYYGPRYYRPYRYGYYGYPYAYSPGIGVGVGPFGFRVF